MIFKKKQLNYYEDNFLGKIIKNNISSPIKSKEFSHFSLGNCRHHYCGLTTCDCAGAICKTSHFSGFNNYFFTIKCDGCVFCAHFFGKQCIYCWLVNFIEISELFQYDQLKRIVYR